MRPFIATAALFCLFLAFAPQAEARGHGQRGERRIGQRVRGLLHPLQNLKERRADRRGGNCGAGNCR